MAENDVLKMKVADLKRELKIRGLATTGNKNELQERLQTAMLDGDLALEDPSIGEDLLDEALTDDEDKGLDLSNEDAVLQSPDKDEDKSLAATLAAEENQQSHKKVVLKRKVSISVPSSTSTLDATSTPATLSDGQVGEKIAKITGPAEASSADDKQADGAKTVIKLSEMSMKDRLEMRAKKFGTSSTASTVDAKSARAARFGQTSTAKSDSNSSVSSSTAQPAATMEMLKKRAERFGCSVSSKMVELERKEKLLKRQERFGEGADETSKSATAVQSSANGTSASSSDYAEKAKQRLERFKTVVK